MRQTEKMCVMDVLTICLLTLQNVTTGTNQLPFRPDAKKHRLSADGGMGAGLNACDLAKEWFEHSDW